MANVPFLSFLAGGLGGYNQGRQQSIQNQQQQEQIDLAGQAQQLADQARKAQLAEQIRAAMAGEDITRSGQGQQNTQFYANLGLQDKQFTARLGQDDRQFGQTLGLQRDQLTQQGNIAQGQLGLGRDQLGLQGYRTLLDALPVLDRSALNPAQRGAFLGSMNDRMGLGASLPGALQTSAGTQGDIRQQQAQIGNLNANTQATLSGIPLAQKRFGLEQQQLQQQLKIAQMQNATQRAITGAQIGLRVTELTADQANRVRAGVEAQLNRIAQMDMSQRKTYIDVLENDIKTSTTGLADLRKQANSMRILAAKDKEKYAGVAAALATQVSEAEQKLVTARATRDTVLSDWGKSNLGANLKR